MTSLISLTDIKLALGSDKSQIINIPKGDVKFVYERYKKDIESKMGIPGTNDVIVYSTSGGWSTHDLMFYLNDLLGPSIISFCTWGLSRLATNQIIKRINDGKITHLNAIVDYRIKDGSDRLSLLSNNQRINLRLTDVHAKVVLVSNGHDFYVVTTSANLSKNKRLESGVIFNDKSIYDYYTNIFIQYKIYEPNN
jgi:hypothetical protein